MPSDSGLIFEIERFATFDGPGIRTVVFMSSCPLCCAWCANPESRDPKRRLMYWKNRCAGCLRCAASCPAEALTAGSGGITIDYRRCDCCGVCAEGCNAQALTLAGELMTAGEVMERVSRDSVFYEQTGGGVTFSGGEPFARFDFLFSLVTEARNRGFHICVETTSCAPKEQIARLSPFINIFLYDIKCIDDAKHIKWTGVSNKLILENYRYLAGNGAGITVRMPLIPSINDGEDDLKQARDFFLELSPRTRIDLLPYHRLGVTKYERLGLAYPLTGLEPPGAESIRRIKTFFEEAGFTTTIGG